MLFVVPILLIILVWLTLFVLVNDFLIPNKNISVINNLLLIFPHADDEVFSAGGLIHRLSKKGRKTTVLILTKGEKGTPDGAYNEHLKTIRIEESKKVAHLLGITHLIQKDFGDGKLQFKKKEIKAYIDSLLQSTHANYVVTFDTSGLYGHPDHIACSEVVTDLVRRKYRKIKLLYATLTKRSLAMITLPEHMAEDKNFKTRRKLPTCKIFIGFDIVSKIKGIYLYKSQFDSFKKGYNSILPLWFIYSAGLYEYFYEVDR